MQQHKAVAIPTYTPKFESNFSAGKHYDPDAERNAAAKLKALYKKEKKGAIRELRKDNKFLAGEKARERKEKDADYEKRMRRVEGEIRTTERAEEKEMERWVRSLTQVFASLLTMHETQGKGTREAEKWAVVRNCCRLQPQRSSCLSFAVATSPLTGTGRVKYQIARRSSPRTVSTE